jgi:glycosyltransferase involved in cell wall biosynthesis
MQPLFSIIIPTYNRIELIDETIQSAIDFVAPHNFRENIIIVDDASQDGTYEYLLKVWNAEINKKYIRLFRNKVNLGVAGARNKGIYESNSKWIIFLDSDDLLLPSSSKNMMNILKQSEQYPIVFFRCMNLESEELNGPQVSQAYDLGIEELLNCGTPGECLPAIKKKHLIKHPYNEEMNGCEGITYADIISNNGCARLEPLIVRKYRTQNIDRLSIGDGFQSRVNDIRIYHKIILFKYGRHLNLSTIIKTIIKIGYYSCLILINYFRRTR